MGTTSLTFQVSGVSELLGYIDRIQSKMAGLDQSMSKAQLSTEMSRVERLVKEAGTFANSLFSALQKMEQVNLSNTANGLKAVGKESVDSSGKVVESSQKAAAAATKSADAITQASTKTAKAQKSAGASASAATKLYTSFAGSITSVITGYASIQTIISAVNAAFQEHNKIIEAATSSMQNYARVSGQLGQKAENAEQLGEYRRVVERLATSGAVADRAQAVNIAYAMLSANMPISEVENMIPVLQAGLMNDSDLAGLIRASGPLMTLNPNVNLRQLMSMAMSASKGNVSDTSKVIQGVADSMLVNREIGTTLEESFALADVIAQSTHNPDEARTWQKNFTKDIWKRVMPKVALAKMHELDPNAETMEGYITGYDSKGNPIIDPNFRMTFTEFASWARDYYGQDKTRLRQDFPDIRGGQGALAVMEAIIDGRYQTSLSAVQSARQTDVVGQKASDTFANSDELRAQAAIRGAQARQDIVAQPEAMLNTYWETAKKNYESAGTTYSDRWWRGAGNAWSWANPNSWTLHGRAEQLYFSPYLTDEQRADVAYQFALTSPEITNKDIGTSQTATRLRSHGQSIPSSVLFDEAVYEAKLKIKEEQSRVASQDLNQGTGTSTPADLALVGTAAERAAAALNNAADAANKAATNLQNQVMPTPGQSGQLTPATL